MRCLPEDFVLLFRIHSITENKMYLHGGFSLTLLFKDPCRAKRYRTHVHIGICNASVIPMLDNNL